MVPVHALALEQFEKRTRIQARHEQFLWDSAWKNILPIALYQKGPDVSEVGSTWLDNLGDMNALRPFTAGELKTLGNETAFFPNTWHRLVSSGNQVVSIPWTVDTRLIIYRRDWLAKVQVDAEHAFETPEALIDTLSRLQAAGFKYPLALATSGLTFHHMASFIWGRGGSFRSPDLKKMSLTEPETRQGMLDYYRLHSFINPQARLLDYAGADQIYLQNKAAVLVSGQWALQTIKNHSDLLPQVRQNSGAALLPGVPYLGGTYLVIWKHALGSSELIQILSHLTDPEVLQQIFHIASSIPARLEALDAPHFRDDPEYQLVIEAVRRGRSFRTARHWATIELRLNAFHEQVWEDVFDDPQMDLVAEIEKRTRELASHIDRTVLSN
jgi:multiple sugar transport system substrate-binding protein